MSSGDEETKKGAIGVEVGVGAKYEVSKRVTQRIPDVFGINAYWTVWCD